MSITHHAPPSARLADYVAIARPDHWIKHALIVPGAAFAMIMSDAGFGRRSAGRADAAAGDANRRCGHHGTVRRADLRGSAVAERSDQFRPDPSHPGSLTCRS